MLVQALMAAPVRQRGCRRAICRRLGRCVPPRDPDDKWLYHCPEEAQEDWEARIPAVYLLGRRLLAGFGQTDVRPGLPGESENADAAARLRWVMKLPCSRVVGPIPKNWEKTFQGPRNSSRSP
jgi:hypothetical protein